MKQHTSPERPEQPPGVLVATYREYREGTPGNKYCSVEQGKHLPGYQGTLSLQSVRLGYRAIVSHLNSGAPNRVPLLNRYCTQLGNTYCPQSRYPDREATEGGTGNIWRALGETGTRRRLR